MAGTFDNAHLLEARQERAKVLGKLNRNCRVVEAVHDHGRTRNGLHLVGDVFSGQQTLGWLREGFFGPSLPLWDPTHVLDGV